MGYFNELLEQKGNKEFLLVEHPLKKGVELLLALEDGGVYRGYTYVVMMNPTVRLAYIVLPKRGFDLIKKNELKEDFDVHGGITFFDQSMFGNEYLIGFDAGHKDDKFDYVAADKYFGEKMFKAMEYKVLLDSLNRFGSSDNSTPKVRTIEYMKKECERLIDQIIEKVTVKH